MKYAFYIDVFFLTNLCFDLIALQLTGLFSSGYNSTIRICMGALFGTLTGCLGICLISNYRIYQIVMHILGNPCMLWVSFGRSDWHIFLKRWGICYFIIFLEGGIFNWLYEMNLFREHLLLSYGVTAVMVLFLSAHWNENQKVRERIYQVELKSKNHSIFLEAFFDTGNTLVDPFLHRPVQIVEKDLVEQLVREENLPVRLVPFHALGTENGMLETVTFEQMNICGKHKKIEVTPVMIGMTTEKLFDNTEYKMILNGKMDVTNA